MREGRGRETGPSLSDRFDTFHPGRNDLRRSSTSGRRSSAPPAGVLDPFAHRVHPVMALSPNDQDLPMTYPTPANIDWPPAQPPHKTNTLAWVAAVLTTLALAGWGGFAYYIYAGRGADTGAQACKELRDGQQPANAKGPSEQKYRALREQFANSGDQDLRKHGVQMMDLTWQVSKLDDPSKDGLPYLSQLIEASTGLRAACANHGVVLPAT